MTTLLLDVGNSRLKWVLASPLHAPLPAATAIAHGGEPAAALATLASLTPQRVCLAHVTGPAHEAALVAAVQQRWGLSPHIARSSAVFEGLRSGYAEPTRLGVDRWLALLAAWSVQRGACCVASAGTALTFDAVDDSGQHLGGVIAPGLATMVAATLGHTRFAVDATQASTQAGLSDGLGRDTETAVRQGALHAAAGALERLAARHSGPRWLCGGDAERLLPHLAGAWQAAPDLVLHGLAVWARMASPA